MGVSPSVHFSDGCLCLRRASVAGRTYQPLTPRYTTFGAFCIVALIALLSSAFSGLEKELRRSDSVPVRWSNVVSWTQGLLVGLYLLPPGD